MAGRYQFILIDTPPSLGFCNRQCPGGCPAGDHPLQAQFYALKALQPVFDIVKRAQSVNPGLHVYAIVPTMYDARNSLSEPVVQAARDQYTSWSLRPKSRSMCVADSPIHGLPVREHDPNSSGATAYAERQRKLVLWPEVKPK